MKSPFKKSIRLQLSAASFALLGLLATQARSGAATYTFNATAPDPASYNTAANWSGGVVPTTSDDAIFDYSLGTTTTIVGLNAAGLGANSLTFGSTAGPLTNAFSLLANAPGTTAARTLTVTSGNFTFAAGNTATITIGGGTATAGSSGVLTLATGATSTTASTGYTFTNNSNQAVNLSAVIGNNGNTVAAAALTTTFAGTGTGVFNIGANNTYGVAAAVTTVTTSIKSGVTVRIGTGVTTPFGAAGQTNIAATGVLQLGGNTVNLNALTAASTAIVENASATAGTLNLSQGSASNTAGNVFAGTLRDGAGGGSLSIVKGAGGNGLVLTGANSYTGSTSTSAVISVGNTGTTGDLGNTSSATMLANGTASNGTIVLSRTDNPTFNYTFAGPGTLLARGTAATAVTLSGTSTFTGSTYIAANASGPAATLSVSSINSVTGGSASSNLGAPTTVANGTITLGGNLTNAVGSTSGGSSGSLLGGNVNGGGILRYIGTGEATDRVIALNTSLASNATTATTTGIQQDGASGTLRFTSALGHTAIGTQTLTLQGSGAGEFAGAINDNSTATVSSTATFASGATTITVTAPTFTLTGGTTSLGIGSAITGPGIAAGTTITNISGTTYTLSQATTAAGTTSAVTFAGGSTGLTKAGAGTWTLSNAAGNTYSGPTAINAGTLLITNTSGSATGTGAVTLGTGTTGTTVGALASGAGNTGFISGTVTANSTARSAITPGGGGTVGMLTLGNLAAPTGVTFNFDIGATSGGISSDILAVGALTGSTTANSLLFNFNNQGAVVGTTYTLLTYTSATNLTLSELTATGLTGTFSLGTNAANEIDFTVTAVPEPSTLAGGTFLFLAMLGWVGYKRRKQVRSSTAH